MCKVICVTSQAGSIKGEEKVTLHGNLISLFLRVTHVTENKVHICNTQIAVLFAT